MASILMHPRNGGLFPADALAEEDLAALGSKTVLVEVRRPRSLPHHRLLFALVRLVVKNCPTPISEKALLSWLKVRAGHVEMVPLAFGQSYAAPSSIAFESMDQGDFNAFFNQAADLICNELIPGLGKPALLAEAQAMLTDRREAA